MPRTRSGAATGGAGCQLCVGARPRDYQTLINECLRRHVESSNEPFEKTLRRVIREELRRAS
ncbi:MAG TPA: hypothetical protein VGI46_10325 [Candidatus Acidoferrum sp.]